MSISPAPLVPRSPRRGWRRRPRVIETSARELPRPPARPRGWTRERLVSAVVGVVLVCAVVWIAGTYFQAWGRGGGLTIPQRQQFSSAGDVWYVNDSTPKVVKFDTSTDATVWMNFTVDGAVFVYLCNSTVPIPPPTGPLGSGCEGGSVESLASGPLGPVGVGAWELGFVNYGPTEGYLPTSAITWTTPLLVLEN